MELDEANYMLGKIYLEGEVIEKNIEKARFHFELADKDNDHSSAQEILLIIGRSYRNKNYQSQNGFSIRKKSEEPSKHKCFKTN
ncbi:MAG: SEL1-like repeat protein [Cytophagaceae bacterium]|nr:SEL1-like repeat protein [Cytophagaceae bacterium]